LIRTRRTFLKAIPGVLLLGAGCLPVGCGGGGKSDGQIPPAPEARNASQAIAEQYSKQAEQYAKQYASQKKGRRGPRR